MPLRKVWSLVCVTAVLSTALTGCTKRQLVPGLIAGAGAAMVTSGAAYRASLDTDRPFGDTDGQIGATTALLFGGLGLLVTGVVWSLTSAHCDDDSHCWPRDRCVRTTHTCVRRAPAATPEGPSDHEEASTPDEGERPALTEGEPAATMAAEPTPEVQEEQAPEPVNEEPLEPPSSDEGQETDRPSTTTEK
jgi:hypothetical protein